MKESACVCMCLLVCACVCVSFCVCLRECACVEFSCDLYTNFFNLCVL